MRDRPDRHTADLRSLALWEKREHGKCGLDHHLPYQVRKPAWTEIRCKLCKHVEIASYIEWRSA